jgi:hypothetical protein
MAAVAVLVLLALAGVPATTVGSLAQDACTWESIANSTVNAFHSSAASDTDNHKMYIYGGLDKDYGVSSKVDVLDLSGATLDEARHSPVAVGGAQERFGAAGAFRVGKGDQSAAYFIGGLDDPGARQAKNDVQAFVPKTKSWSRLSIANAIDFQARAFASAAYDPVHDVIWVVGGIAACQFSTVIEGTACGARPISTQYLSFDAATGEPTWNTLSGAAQSFFGASMIYDEVGQRMVIFGGTSTITAGDDRLLQLDLTNADAARASIKPLAANGSSPQLYFHGGAYDSTNRQVLYYGGVIRNYLEANEVPNEETWALNLAGTKPTWKKLSPAGNPKVRIGAVMGYSAKHAAVILSLGRDKTKQVDSAVPPTPEPIESETVQRGTYAMTCMGPAVTSPVPTTPSPTAGTPTGSPTAPRTATASATKTATVPPSPLATDTPTATTEPPTVTPTSPPLDAFLPVAYRQS